MRNVLSIDVEEYFHSTEMQGVAPYEWNTSTPPRCRVWPRTRIGQNFLLASSGRPTACSTCWPREIYLGRFSSWDGWLSVTRTLSVALPPPATNWAATVTPIGWSTT